METPAVSVLRHERCTAPRVDPAVIVRKPVLDLLHEGVGQAVVVTAPAGYGKTSQVVAWAERDPRPLAWATLEPGDNDPGVLGPLLTDLLHDATGCFGETLPGTGLPAALQVAQAAPVLAHRLRTCASRFVLVLDDVHVLEDGPAMVLVEALLANLPATATVVLVGRSRPAMPLANLRVRPGLVEIGAGELALEPVDATRVFEDLGADVAPEVVGDVVEAFEGWPVGIRLLAASLCGRPGGDPLDLSSIARVGAIADFITEEWLRGLDPVERGFLLAVSGLDWLSGPLCDHVLDRDDSGEILHRLHQDRVLAVPLDAHGSTYRLHHLVREALDAEHERRARAQRRAIDLRASHWFEEEGDIDRAVRHAVRARDLPRVERLVADHAVPYRISGRHFTVQRWLDHFPPDHVRASPLLCLVAALVAVGEGRGEESVEWLRIGAHAAAVADGDGPPSVVSLQIATHRAMLSLDGPQPALADARAAMAAIPPGFWHAAAGWAAGGTSWEVGEPADAAAATLSAAANEAGVCGAVTVEAQARAMLAVVLAASGDVHGADGEALTAKRVAAAANVDRYPPLFLVLAVSARAAARRGEAELAADEAAVSRANLERFGPVVSWLAVPGRIVLADTYRLLGDLRTATDLLGQAEAGLHQMAGATGLEAEWRAACDRLDQARSVLVSGAEQLTAAELRVVQLLPTNLSLADIAERLYISRNTAKSHVAAAYRKLGVSSRREAVERARAAGLLRPSDEDLVSR